MSGREKSMNFLNQIQKKHILVVGDIMLDSYYTGEVRRISPEAPVPVFHKLGERSVPGGAANVSANLSAANQAVSLLSVVGNDFAGTKLIEHLNQMDVDVSMILPLQSRTTQKVRFIAENNQQVLRMDEEDTSEISPELSKKLLDLLDRRMNEFDLVILSDYNKGLLSEDITQGVISAARAHGIYTLVDVKDPRVEKYRGAYLLKPNASELHMMTGLPTATSEEVIEASLKLRELTCCQYVLTTRGSQGMILVGEELTISIDADDRKVYDVTGAGDTALAYLAVSLANGLPIDNAVKIANYAAGIQVTKVGTSAITLREVGEVIAENGQDISRKLLDRTSCAQLRQVWMDKRIVFTNGCFDILHVGHIRYLRKAAQLGDLLVIGLNSDNSIRRLKGRDRPVNTEYDRAEVLASLEFVDYIIFFEEDTPYELIQEIQPDVLVKGGDYRPEEVVGREIVEARGGSLVLIDFVDGKSTTGIIQRIRHGGYDEI